MAKPDVPLHVLITGGAGFIGSHTAEALLERGARVRVLDDFSSGRESNLPSDSRLSIVRGDIRDRGAVSRAMEGASHVLHLAAQVSVTASVEDPLASHSRNILGFLNVLDAARRAGVSRFVYASSAAVFGEPKALPLDEDSPLAPLSPYGLEKRVNEQYAALHVALYGMSCLGLRYFNVYGPRQDPSSPYSGVISIFAARALAGAPLTVFGDGGQTRDFIYVRDVARANVGALESRFDGVVNVATGASVSLLELVDALGACLGTRLQLDFRPAREGDIRDSACRGDRLKQWLGIEACTPLKTGLQALLAGLGQNA